MDLGILSRKKRRNKKAGEEKKTDPENQGRLGEWISAIEKAGVEIPDDSWKNPVALMLLLELNKRGGLQGMAKEAEKLLSDFQDVHKDKMRLMALVLEMMKAGFNPLPRIWDKPTVLMILLNGGQKSEEREEKAARIRESFKDVLPKTVEEGPFMAEFNAM